MRLAPDAITLRLLFVIVNQGWRIKVFLFVKVTFALPPCALSPQCFLDALAAHNSPSLSTSLSPQCLHSLVLATLLSASHSRLVALQADAMSIDWG